MHDRSESVALLLLFQSGEGLRRREATVNPAKTGDAVCRCVSTQWTAFYKAIHKSGFSGEVPQLIGENTSPWSLNEELPTNGANRLSEE